MDNDNLNDKLNARNQYNGFGSSSQDPNKQQNQDQIKKLGEQLNQNNKDDDDDDRKAAFGIWFKRILIIVLILVLLAGIGIAIYFLSRNKDNITGGGQIKLSTVLSENIDPETGGGEQSIKVKEVYPGDKFPVVVAVRNADKFSGDESTEGANIYVRYKIAVVVDGQEYTNIILPVISELEAENWHIYNPEEEKESYVWDGYYYHYGSLKPQQSLTLFNEIQFSYENTTNYFGSKKAQIVVSVEAVEANISNIGEEENNAWNTAPRKWIDNMKRGINNQGNRINN